MNATSYDPADAQAALSYLLAHDYCHFRKFGADDWRDPQNDAWSLSSKGFFDHKSGENGDIFHLARKHGWQCDSSRHSTRSKAKPKTSSEPSDSSKAAARLWQKAETESARERTRSYLTEQRKIPLENFEDLLGALIRSTEDQGKQILIVPMLTPDQALKAEIGGSFSVEKIHRVIFQGGGKPEKKQLGGGDEVGRITYFPPHSGHVESLQFLAVEGLEDSLTLRNAYPDHHVLVCQSKGNLKHVSEFLPQGAEVLIIADHDAHENPSQNGEVAAAKLREQLISRGCKCMAVMPAEARDDPNNALQQGSLQEWVDSVIEVPELPRSKDDFFLEPRSALKIHSPDWLIQGVIEKGTLAAVIGESGSGKSFLALDLAACVQTGKPWHGRDVQQGDVVYLAGEGRSGLVRRIGAWEHRYKDSLDDLMISSRAIDLGDRRNQLPKVQQALQALEKPPVLIVIDTLARHHTGDENSASEMSSFISNLDRLSEEFKATVLIVHHAGKDPSRGARGSSAFRAALDHEIRVTKPETGITNLTCEKAKDAEPFPPMSFRLKQSDVVDELGRMLAEPDGSPVRSCVLEEIEYIQPSSKAKQLTEKQAEAQQLFFELRKQSEDGIVTRSSWYKALESKNIATSDVAKKRLLDLMVEMGTFTVQGEGRDVYFTTKTHIDFEVS